MAVRPLKPEELRWKCPMDALDFKTTDDIKPTGEIVGQERAIRALKLGLEIPSIGYNMFVTGVSGTGRETTIKRILDGMDTTTDDLRDIMYVRNMEEPGNPVVLTFPAGDGSRFVDALEECVALLKSNIPAVLSSEKAEMESRALKTTFSDRKKGIMEQVKNKASKDGFTIVNVPVGPGEFRPDVLPVMNDEPVTFDTLEGMKDEGKLSQEDLDRYTQQHEDLFKELTQAFRKTRDLDIEFKAKIEKMSRRLVQPTIAGIIAILKEIGDDKADRWADSLVDIILENLSDFAGSSDDNDPYVLFIPNLIVDNSGNRKRPVLIEEFPDSVSLFGNIERVIVDNKPYSDHTMIRPGAIHMADGGYLIMNALDLVREPSLWQRLIQTLRNQTTVIRCHDPMGIYPVHLHPEPLDTNVKVILIGSSMLYQLLASYEPEFGLLFRIRAAFDFTMEATKDNVRDFANVVAGIIRSEKLLPMNPGAVAQLVEESARIAGIPERISLEFNRVTDYLRQSTYFARRGGDVTVTEEHVREAIRQKIFRLNLGETYATRQIVDRTVMIDTEGRKVGQVNGLAVYQGVDYAFGLPVRITTRVSAGRKGLINVERESDMSGTTHTKGMLIISGFIQGKFAREYPLSLSASVVFEQSYGGIEGDSASSTELYVLLSALSELPVRQDIAVTGSVNQFGEIQAIGGVNEKIEGFYRVCCGRGLTGEQGVMIPGANVKDLHLRENVIESVSEGRFHIYPVDCIDEGAELLMGTRAGELMPDGMYEPDTIYGKVDRRLRQMAETLRSFAFHD
ncbi:MAG: AAA family ATPase [Candidatus Fermentibacteraceae bacterium]|nr:AAA family ATPase [Candidatus Fermentibacteraceae bacterium]MBN2607510.1 AAA family ATPase [Candidatus Fermentibacteraceae bacterium]